MPETKKWILPPEAPADVQKLVDSLRISQAVARVLVNRGLTDPRAAMGFLQPKLNDLTDPCEHAGIVEAAGFLLEASRAGRRISIYGDFDADGICSAALLERCFRFLGANVDFYIPHRVDEGYGLNREAIEELANGGTEVIVTVDCGISSFEEVAFAREYGLDVVVTDHHEPGEQIPDATYMLNPKLPGQDFGYKYLAGVGVAFKLMWAIGQQYSGGPHVTEDFKDLLLEALALVAIGTIADVVPLVDENRILTQYGLKTLLTAASPGLRELVPHRHIRGRGVTARDVAFLIAPKLNAAGRMGEARDAVEMLITDDSETADMLSNHLEMQNRLRRATQKEAVQKAKSMVEASPELQAANCLVLSDSQWHQGVVGLVASRLCDELWRPVFVFVEEDGWARGSARSIPGFSLFDAVSRCEDLLERYGGHAGAAGLTLSMENLPAFTERINAIAGEMLGTEAPVPELELYGDLPLSALSKAVVLELERLEPCGRDNPTPMFAASGLHAVGYPQIVGSSHLVFWVRQGQTTLRAFGPHRAGQIDEIRARQDESFSLAFEPYINDYRGESNVELRVQDLQWDSERLFQERGSPPAGAP